ncbi:MAG TPA: hypothetical protein PLN06_02920 [Bacteroidales bacterium]|nr:hypothetical protein [Bacteroidales bacterium]HOU95561.1 hypothetical protein [Bacteroidales bacterium]HQG53485.1 hypothetical protein [Bacteroidales bacterium]
MDFNSTIEIIIKDLREVRDIIDDFKNYQGVPPLQVELAKLKCKSAEEAILLLKTFKPEDVSAVPKRSPYPQEKEISVDETLIEISDEEFLPENEQKFCATKVDADQHENVTKEHAAINVAKTESAGGDSVSSVEQSPSERKPDIYSKEKESEYQIFADKFSGTQTTLLDQFASKASNETSHLIMGRSISSLTDAIGINDRFLFIREIFGGDSRTYDEVISRLDQSTSFNEARAILFSYTGEHEDNEYIRQLLDFVKRKFPADG